MTSATSRGRARETPTRTTPRACSPAAPTTARTAAPCRDATGQPRPLHMLALDRGADWARRTAAPQRRRHTRRHALLAIQARGTTRLAHRLPPAGTLAVGRVIAADVTRHVGWAATPSRRRSLALAGTSRSRPSTDLAYSSVVARLHPPRTLVGCSPTLLADWFQCSADSLITRRDSHESIARGPLGQGSKEGMRALQVAARVVTLALLGIGAASLRPRRHADDGCRRHTAPVKLLGRDHRAVFIPVARG